jgi:hypothetical protein
VIPIRGKRGIWIFTAFAAVLLFFAVLLLTPKPVPFSITLRGPEGAERIEPWKDEKGNLYIFLPGYAQLQDVTFLLDTDTKITLNDEPLQENMSCSHLDCNINYNLEYRVFGMKKNTQLTFLRSGGVATMFLSTATGSMEYIHERKENEESGTVRLYEHDGALNCKSDKLTLKGRGNATWTAAEKKAYTVTLSQEADLLGMGKAQKWLLLANAADHSHLRNKLVYDYAVQLGLDYTPDTQWVDLYLNGEYAGLYLLSEKNEVHPERIDIGSGESYLLSDELRERLEAQGLPFVSTDGGQALRIHYPQNINLETQTMLNEKWQSIENAILSENGIDPVSGQHFWDMADQRSWVLQYLIDEVSGNMDGFKASRYFYFSNDGKIYAGPVWDYDKALGNDTDIYWSIANPRVQILNRYSYDSQSPHYWAEGLYEQPWFREQIQVVFEKEILETIELLTNEKISEYADLIRSAAQMDRVRWLSEEEGSFDEAVLEVSTYLKEHTQFLKEIWVEQKHFCQISVLKSGRSLFFTVPTGGCLEELPNISDWSTKKFAGWYYCETDEPFDITRPITEDIQIYVKWEDGIRPRVKQLVNLFPLGILAVIGLGVVAVDWRRRKKSGSVVE